MRTRDKAHVIQVTNQLMQIYKEWVQAMLFYFASSKDAS